MYKRKEVLEYIYFTYQYILRVTKLNRVFTSLLASFMGRKGVRELEEVKPQTCLNFEDS